jgi:DNA-binding response OmpR family regulator
VVARVHAVLRRGVPAALADERLRWNGLEVDSESMTATVGSALLDLTPTEFCLLTTLMQSPTRAFSRLQLLEKCLPDSEALERVVDTHVYNLRKKLELAGISEVLINVRSVGYRFRQP